MEDRNIKLGNTITVKIRSIDRDNLLVFTKIRQGVEQFQLFALTVKPDLMAKSSYELPFTGIFARHLCHTNYYTFESLTYHAAINDLSRCSLRFNDVGFTLLGGHRFCTNGFRGGSICQ